MPPSSIAGCKHPIGTQDSIRQADQVPGALWTVKVVSGTVTYSLDLRSYYARYVYYSLHVVFASLVSSGGAGVGVQRGH